MLSSPFISDKPMDILFITLAVLVGVLVGIAKTGVPGLGILIVPIMAMLFPAKTSVGVLLPMLVFADIFAVIFYRKSAQWNKIFSLFPFVVIGMISAIFLLKHISNEIFTPLLGILILSMVILDYLKKKYKWEKLPNNKIYIASIGILAGFATTLGNAAGPIMSIYLLTCGLDKKEFMGTGAWYFLIINTMKIPMYVYIGTITTETLLFNAYQIPIILLGVYIGVSIFKKINQDIFQKIVYSLTVASAILLIFK